MDIYHIWCDLKDGVRDMDFVEKLEGYMDFLRDSGKIESFRVTRKKLGLAPAHLGEWHIMIETENLAQLEAAFQLVAARDEPVESRHFSVNSLVRNATFGLYRDFPDPVRKKGMEKF